MRKKKTRGWLQLVQCVEWHGKRRPYEDQKRDSRFRAGWALTKDDLYREVRFLMPKGEQPSAVLSLDVDDASVRIDGKLRGNASPKHSGVQIYIESRYGQLEYQCDMYRRWEDNARAIVFTLQRLRMAELYGCVKRGEQYVGFKALPAPEGMEPAGPLFANPTEAMVFLIEVVSEDLIAVPKVVDVLSSQDKFIKLWRMAAKKAHPDHGGQRGLFEKVKIAKDIIEKFLRKTPVLREGKHDSRDRS